MWSHGTGIRRNIAWIRNRVKLQWALSKICVLRRSAMRVSGKSLLTASVVLLSVAVWGQQLDQPKVLARLSYDSGVSLGEGLRHECVSVSKDGYYRIVRTTDNGQVLRAQGKLPEEKFEQLKKSLDSKGFQKLSQNYGGGIILQNAEIFAAELPGPVEFDGPDHAMKDHTRRVRWLNADGENPFPAAIVAVVDWLKHFEPKEGKQFEEAEFQDVCPSVGLSLVQPSVAGNTQR